MRDKYKHETWFSHIVHADTNKTGVNKYADSLPPENIPHIHSEMLPDKVLGWLRENKSTIIIGLATFSLLVLGWIIIGTNNSKVVFGQKTYKSSINLTELNAQLGSQISSYRLNFQYPDKSIKSYSLSEMGIELDAKQTSEKMNTQRYSIGQLLAWWRPIKPTISYKVDRTKLGKFIATNVSRSINAPQDATISVSDGNVVIGDSKEGQQVFLNRPTDKIISSAGKLDAKPLVLSIRTIKPSLTANDFNQYKDQINQIINQKIVLKIDDRTITPSPGDIADWLDIGTDSKAKKVNVSVNSGKVQGYIDRVTYRYTRSVKTQVVITKADGSTLVIVPGQNGVSVTNKGQVASEIASALLSGKGLEKTLVTKDTPFQTVNGSGVGKWIEVDISLKRLYAFEDSTLVNSFPVSAGAPATPTVLGRYTIYAKYAVQDMRGNNVDGSTYFQPNVRWINYFYGGYAIHGNYWRPVGWFGNINSSHGCVGLMDSQAEWVYDWAPLGTPVITHS